MNSQKHPLWKRLLWKALSLLKRLGIAGEGPYSLENRLIAAIKLLRPSNYTILRQVTRHPLKVIWRLLVGHRTQELLLPHPVSLRITPVNLLALLQVWGKLKLLHADPAEALLIWEVAPSFQIHTYTEERSDICALEEVFLRKVYGHSYEGLRVLDVGGYSGESTLFFLMNGAVEVACVEPAPALVEHIQKHLNLNRVTERVKLYPVALGAVDGEGELLLASEMLGNRLASAEDSADRLPKVKVPIWSFSRLLETLGWDAVDVAKIDCEGCEYGLFSATPEDVLKRVKVWFVEVHGPVGAVAERLRSLGYEVEYDLYWREMYNLRAWQSGARLPWEAPSVHQPEMLTS